MSSLFKIERVAVLGTGVMGSQIAAHLTNAKIPVYAFDISQDVSQKGLDDSLKLKPSAYYNPKSIDLITPLNYNDHLDKISECDWVISIWDHTFPMKKIQRVISTGFIILLEVIPIPTSSLFALLITLRQMKEKILKIFGNEKDIRISSKK